MSIATEEENGNRWLVYIILCDDGSLYTGITTDLTRRWLEHNGQRKGAKFFRGRKPLHIAYVEEGHDRSSASRREAAIKRLSRVKKEALLRAEHNQARILGSAIDNRLPRN
jgi:putative endonuclease